MSIDDLRVTNFDIGPNQVAVAYFHQFVMKKDVVYGILEVAEDYHDDSGKLIYKQGQLIEKKISAFRFVDHDSVVSWL